MERRFPRRSLADARLAFRPRVEGLEDRCVPDATSLSAGDLLNIANLNAYNQASLGNIFGNLVTFVARPETKGLATSLLTLTSQTSKVIGAQLAGEQQAFVALQNQQVAALTPAQIQLGFTPAAFAAFYAPIYQYLATAQFQAAVNDQEANILNNIINPGSPLPTTIVALPLVSGALVPGTYTGAVSPSSSSGFSGNNQSGQYISLTLTSVANGIAQGSVTVLPFGGSGFVQLFAGPIRTNLDGTYTVRSGSAIASGLSGQSNRDQVVLDHVFVNGNQLYGNLFVASVDGNNSLTFGQTSDNPQGPVFVLARQ